MTIEELKKLNSVLYEMESAAQKLQYEKQMKEAFEKATWTEVRIEFSNGNLIAIDNIPKEMIKSLLDAYYTSLRIKRIECERFLFVSGINVGNQKNLG